MKILRLFRPRATTIPLVVWTALAIGIAYWSYRDIMASCPELDDFAGCFEPPYRFAANVAFFLWLAIEIPLVLLWLAGRRGARGERGQGAAGGPESSGTNGAGAA